jgi:hypothetical protein
VGIGADLGGGIATVANVGAGGIVIPSVLAAAGISPDTIYISPWMYDATVQGTWEILVSGSYMRRAALITNPPADQNAVNFKDYFEAGTYTLQIIGTDNSSQGIMKVKIDGSTVATWDKYAAGTAHNQISTTTDIAVALSGVKTIQVLVDGKNGSSSDYGCVFYEMIFYRTA